MWSTDTPTLLRDIIDVDEYALANADRDAMKGRRATPAKQRSVLAQTSTARALFNTHIAEILGIRYAASLARVPALRVIAEDSRHIVAQLTQVAPAEQALQDVFGEAAIAATRKKPDFLEIPFFAAEVFQRADVPMQIPEILDDVRAKSRAFRERLLEINVAIDAGDRAGVDRLRASLRTEATLSVWRRLGFPATTATTTSLDVYLTLTDPTATALAIIVAVMGAVLNWDSIRPLLGRSRPVCGLVEDISPIVKSTEAITKLWNIDDTALWIPRMRSLTSLSQRTFGEAIR